MYSIQFSNHCPSSVFHLPNSAMELTTLAGCNLPLSLPFYLASMCVCAPRRNPAPDGRTRMQNGVID